MRIELPAKELARELAQALAPLLREEIQKAVDHIDAGGSLLTATDVCRMKHVGRNTVLAALRSGELPARQRQGRGNCFIWEIRAADADAWNPPSSKVYQPSPDAAA